MSNKTTSQWKRVVAFILTLVMVFGMLPANVASAEELPEQGTEESTGTQEGTEETTGTESTESTEETTGTEEGTETVLLGTVEPITEGGTLKEDGNGMNYSNLTLEWVEKNTAVGRNDDGWWVGIKVNAPSSLLTKADFDKVTYNYNGGETKVFWDMQDSDKTAESAQRYITLWGLVNEKWAADFANQGKTLNYIWNFDWDGDTVTDQTVTLTVDPKTVTLMKAGEQMFPAPYGEGAVSAVTPADGVSCDGNTVTYSNVTLHYVEANSLHSAGWWVGIRVDAPEGMTLEAQKAATYNTNGGTTKSFWNAQDSAQSENATDPRYITLWGLVNQGHLENFLSQGKSMNYRWNFDWNNDGYFEQNVVLTIDPNGVVLYQNGEKVYPLVMLDVDVNITGNGTVTIDGAAVDGETDAQVIQGKEVAIVVTPGDDHTKIASLTINGEQVPVAADGTYSGNHVFTENGSINVEFVTEYTVTFTHGNGQFKDANGNKLGESVTLKKGESISFTYEVFNDYAYTIYNGETDITADVQDGGYTIANIDADCEIKAVTEDKTAPVISNAQVSNPEKWMTSKVITFEVKDNNPTGTVTTYISTTNYSTLAELQEANEPARVSGYEIAVIIEEEPVTYYVYAVDAAGNMSCQEVAVKMIDTTEPTFVDFEVAEKYGSAWIPFAGEVTWLESITYTFKVEDNESGVKVYDADKGQMEVWYERTKRNGEKENVYLTPDANGVYTVTFYENVNITFYAMNNAGIQGNTAPNNATNFDTHEPVIDNISMPSEWQNNKLTVEFTVTDNQDDNESDIKIVYYYKEGSTETTTLNVNEESGKYEFVAYENGTYYIYAEDNYGLNATEKVVVTKVDNTTPVVQNIESSADGWTNQNVVISGQVYDAQSGVAEVYYSTSWNDYLTFEAGAGNVKKATLNGDRYTFTVPVGDGEFNDTYYVWAVDKTGQKSAYDETNLINETQQIKVQIDLTAPVVSAAVYSEPLKKVENVSDAGYELVYKEEAGVTITAADDRSDAVLTYEYTVVNYGQELAENAVWTPCEASFTYGENFLGRIYVRAIDDAGNPSEPYCVNDGTDADVIVIDHETPDAPVLMISSTGEDHMSLEAWNEARKPDENADDPEENAWVQMMDIILSNSETLSGVDHYEYSTDGGANWITITGIDGDGTQADDALAALCNNLIINKDANATYSFRAVSNTGVEGEEVTLVVKVHTNNVLGHATLTINDVTNQKENGWFTEMPTIIVTEPAYVEGDPIVTTWFSIRPERESVGDIDKYPRTTLRNNKQDGKEQLGENGELLYAHDITEQIKAELIRLCNVKSFEEVEGIFYLEVASYGPEGYTCGQAVDSLIMIDNQDPTDLKIYVQESGEEAKTEVNNTHKDANGNEVFIFDKFYDDAITIWLEADMGESAGSDDCAMHYQLVESLVSVTDDWKLYDEDTGITVNPSEKMYVIFRATDAAGNQTVITSTGIVVDNKKPSGSVENEIDLSTNVPDPNQGEFYTENFTVGVTVVEPLFEGENYDANGDFSGLKSVTYRIYTEDTYAEGETGPEHEGEIALTGDSVKVIDGLVASVSGEITVDVNKFNSNNVYIVIEAVDNADNKVTTKIGPFKIDVTHPKIDISYDNNTSRGVYYNAARTAIITVTERNFDPALVKWTVQIYNDAKNAYENFTIPAEWYTREGITNEWERTEGTGNLNNTTWTLKIPFLDDNDYKFEISMTDKAGRENDPITYSIGEGENKNPVESEKDINAHEFTIDTIDPEISVVYTNNDVTNGMYFDDYRSAQVTVTEHNFDPDNTSVTITVDGTAQIIRGTSFTRNGDNWTVDVPCSVDGVYTFTASATDLAGRTNGGIINFNGSAAPENFVIDTTIVEPGVGGVEDGGAYKDEVAPSVDINDVNYEGHTIKLTRTTKGQKDVDVTEEFRKHIVEHEQGATVNYEDFPRIRENDGIYTLTVTMTDKAGNTSTTVTTFTVNRFGSVYVFGDYLTGLVENGGAYVTEITEDLTLTEYNPDQLVEGSVRVEITRDGRPLDQVKFDVTPEVNDKVQYGESGWYEYLYTISMENFTEDGVYKITILSEDRTGNASQNSDFEDLVITFRVDSTAPELSSVVGLEERIINAQEVDVRYTVFDAIGLESITVYVNGEVYEVITDFGGDLNNYSGSFKLTERNDVQSVQIVIKDLAGNILDTDGEGFTSAYEFNSSVTVSTNWFVRWFANKPLFFGSLAGGAGGLWLLWFLIFGKRKKEEEEEQAV